MINLHKNIKYSLLSNHMQGKRVVPSRVWTCTSCSPGECPNQLDHLHYMFCPCLNSSLRAYCLIQDFDIGALPSSNDLFRRALVHVHCSLLRQYACTCALDGLPSYLSISRLLIIMKEIKYSLLSNYMQGKRVVPSRVWTCTSCSQGEHPNQLGHLHYMFCPCLNSSLRAYCLIQDFDIGALPSSNDLFRRALVHAHC